jgi:hypothetical protein
MYINYPHKFIFIHLPKTGGTSVINYFSNNNLGKHLSVWENEIHESGIKKGLRKHITASQLKKIRPTIFKRFKTYAIVRNPWDLVVSWYTYVKRLPSDSPRSTANCSFPYFIHKMKHVWNGYGEPNNTATGITQFDYVSNEKGNIIVNKILKYEHLKLMGFGNGIRKSFSWNLPRQWKPTYHMKTINASRRSPDYRSYYDKDTKAIVRKAFMKDINEFGYEY